jgi:hypothetical protein
MVLVSVRYSMPVELPSLFAVVIHTTLCADVTWRSMSL